MNFLTTSPNKKAYFEHLGRLEESLESAPVLFTRQTPTFWRRGGSYCPARVKASMHLRSQGQRRSAPGRGSQNVPKGTWNIESPVSIGVPVMHVNKEEEKRLSEREEPFLAAYSVRRKPHIIPIDQGIGRQSASFRRFENLVQCAQESGILRRVSLGPDAQRTN